MAMISAYTTNCAASLPIAENTLKYVQILLDAEGISANGSTAKDQQFRAQTILLATKYGETIKGNPVAMCATLEKSLASQPKR
jgi:hypothetical protein